MALTKGFMETVKARAGRDAVFRRALLREALDTLFEGDGRTGRALLRAYVDATVGFEGLARIVRTPARGLDRMLGPRGNPTANELFRVLAALQQAERVDARVLLRRAT